jgi:hypothetical protein
MPGRSPRTVASDSLFDEVSGRLPLFDDLPTDVIQLLTASGFGRGFLTASLRARLRKAGYRDLGHLTQASPDAIAGIRKFGPIRVERVRTFLLDAIARWLPGARAVHTAAATGARRLGRLADLPVDHLPLEAGAIAALGLAGGSCAEMAGRSRHALLATGVLTSHGVDGIVTTLARVLGGDRTDASSGQAAIDAPATEPEAGAAHRAALLAKQDREWEEAAPARA